MGSSDQLMLFAQAAALLFTFFWAVIRATLYIPYALLRIFLRACLVKIGLESLVTAPSGASFYKGSVFHSRKRPKENSFIYPVRMGIIDLDSPPPWWRAGDGDTLTADQARELTGTSGPVRILTHPPAAGYTQNPISVYYCYKKGAEWGEGKPDPIPEKCLAEVTNTPWGERVTFVFRPAVGELTAGEEVSKALHVSPLMDMKSTWTVKAPPPTGSKIFLSVAATHPEYGDYFLATLDAKRDTTAPQLPNEVASVGTLLQFGFQPQRVAAWIYWQAVVLLWKGVSFYPPPGDGLIEKVAKSSKHPRTKDGRAFVWRGAQEWPWKWGSNGGEAGK